MGFGFFSRIKRTARAMRIAWSSKSSNDEKIPTYEETSLSRFSDEKIPQGNNFRESTAIDIVAPPAYAHRSTPAPQKGTVALHHAAFTGNVLLTSAHLCTPGINVNTTDKHGYTPLLYAAQKGRVGVVKRLLKTPEIEVNPCDSFGISALSWAARRGHLEVVELLCKTPGVTVDHKCGNRRERQYRKHAIDACESGWA
ncbi:uncharacterized protein LAJ45_09482 [Morchella importuna]|uniref:uncharacterized protein n=1 Tax=Morchella importuna TaxID=1174673 RepID=UPI001E8DD567|nr:uncharacterized protein LAJ45_09482 [Morchella importuna]KAH8146536.1 hypothetical protein LAJ45_09482 [Morchella importuna]